MKIVHFFKEIYSLGKTIVFTILIAMLINLFVVQIYRVEGTSMLPTLKNKDFTVVSKWNGTYQYGDIVVIDSRTDKIRTLIDDLTENPVFATIRGSKSNDEHYIWIKRVIGLENDRLQIINDRLYRNGLPVDEPYILEEMELNPNLDLTVPKGSIFVMGDNRNNSKDSRFIGSIPIENVMGKVIFP